LNLVKQLYRKGMTNSITVATEARKVTMKGIATNTVLSCQSMENQEAEKNAIKIYPMQVKI